MELETFLNTTRPNLSLRVLFKQNLLLITINHLQECLDPKIKVLKMYKDREDLKIMPLKGKKAMYK